ncbi:MAG: Crp/Fnr family transcriptional regulator [Alphaproteobacteria bacterium]|nr:Crp/Fnr family transcriptional regulator [Alphaproteobacteria bacterium]
MDRFLRWKSFRAGQEIINREDKNSDLLFVTKGKVRVVIYTLSGREVTLDDIEAGSFFGEMAAIDKEPRSASVIALEPSEIAFLPAERFEEGLKKESQVALRIMHRMSMIIRHANERIVELSTLGANNRIHAEILRLARKKGIEKNGKIYISPIPVHSDIAARISTVRETVARAMSDLAKQGIVIRENGALVVQDVKRLEQMVQDVRGDIL